MTKEKMQMYAKAHLNDQLAKWKQFKVDFKNGACMILTEKEIDEAIDFYSEQLADLEKDN